MNSDIISGRDELGLMIFSDNLPSGFNGWWIGSLLDIDETREILREEWEYSNATCLQVAISMVSALIWMIRNPNSGILLPDDVPHTEVLKYALPFLGPFVSKPVKVDLNAEMPEIYGNNKSHGKSSFQFESFKAL